MKSKWYFKIISKLILILNYKKKCNCIFTLTSKKKNHPEIKRFKKKKLRVAQRYHYHTSHRPLQPYNHEEAFETTLLPYTK